MSRESGVHTKGRRLLLVTIELRGWGGPVQEVVSVESEDAFMTKMAGRFEIWKRKTSASYEKAAEG